MADTEEKKLGTAEQYLKGMDSMSKDVEKRFTKMNKALGRTDGYLQACAQLERVNDGLRTQQQLQDRVQRTAQNSRVAYEKMAGDAAGLWKSGAFGNNDQALGFAQAVRQAMALSGTGATQQQGVMDQLAKDMAAGGLSGAGAQLLVQQATPMAQAIADLVHVPISQLQQLAEAGGVSAEAVRTAMAGAAEDINAQFSALPMTFGQLTAGLQDLMSQALAPLVELAAIAGQGLMDNWRWAGPVLETAAFALGALTLAMQLHVLATKLAEAATKEFFASLLASPITWIILAIGVVIGLIYQWVQSVGGVRAAWAIATNAVLSMWETMKLGGAGAFFSIQDTVGAVKVNVLNGIQDMVNGAIDRMNGLIEVARTLTGLDLDLADHVSFGDQAQAEYNAAMAQRADELARLEEEIRQNRAQRAEEIARLQAGSGGENAGLYNGYGQDGALNVDSVNTVKNVGGEVNIADEDLKFLRDVAEMRYIQNYVTLTPTVAMNASISERVDVNTVVSAIERKLEEEFSANAAGVYA